MNRACSTAGLNKPQQSWNKNINFWVESDVMEFNTQTIQFVHRWMKYFHVFH